MKRKCEILVFLLLLSALLTGCQSNGQQQSKAAALPLREAVEQALIDKEEFVAYTADDLSDIMGIMPEDYTEAVFLVSKDSLSGREIIAVRAKDADAQKAAAEALNRYLKQRMEETRNYLPEVYKLQNDTRVESKGLTAVLIVGPHGTEETKAFLAGE